MVWKMGKKPQPRHVDRSRNVEGTCVTMASNVHGQLPFGVSLNSSSVESSEISEVVKNAQIDAEAKRGVGIMYFAQNAIR